MSRRAVWGLVVAVASVFVALSAGAGSAAVLSTREVYAKVARALDRPGRVYYESGASTLKASSAKSGTKSGIATAKTWADVRGGTLREETVETLDRSPSSAPSFHYGTVIDGGARYRQFSVGRSGAQSPAPTCQGASASVSAVLGCPDAPSNFRVHQSIEAGKLGGRAAVVLVTDTKAFRGANVLHSQNRLYLDPKTFLPFATRGTMTIGSGAKQQHSNSAGSIRSSFVPATSLSPDFFTPASIDAWVASSPEPTATTTTTTP